MVHCRRLLLFLGLALWSATALAADAPGSPLAHATGDGEEQVRVLLPADGYSAPAIEVLGGDSPRVVADFGGITAWKGPAVLEVDSPLVRRVRAWLHGDEQRLRVVLDLAADPKGMLISHTYEGSDGILWAVIILRPIGAR